MSDLYWDPFTPELRNDPYPLWKRMRDEAPVWHNDRYDFWALSRFHDIEAANKDHETFVSSHGTTVETMSDEPNLDTGMIIWTDPPKHTRLRKLVSRAFTAKRVSSLEDRMREVCGELLDPHVGEKQFDYEQDFTAVHPPTKISMMLGVHQGERD
jgi:cytochrome P450